MDIKARFVRKGSLIKIKTKKSQYSSVSFLGSAPEGQDGRDLITPPSHRSSKCDRKTVTARSTWKPFQFNCLPCLRSILTVAAFTPSEAD